MIAGPLAAWAWLTLRLFAILRAQTIWRAAAGGMWWAIVGALAAVLAGAWTEGRIAPVAWPSWLLAAGFELLLGSVLGALVSLPGEAALGAARRSGLALGLGEARAFAALQLALVGSLAFVVGLHRPLLAGLRACASRWPVGEPGAWRLELDVAAASAAAHDATVLALGLATPVLLTTAVVELALAFAARSGPVAALAAASRPWLVAVAALTALAAAWAVHPEAWLESLPHA
ncbi:flagellar biosynthetic protein FliR [Nannocystis punicea]|uniref:Flagellar biosynthetic protein FliR n=1 Tax=Nannocystis punicea TaxID=2995304 RepID=A0ABY7HJU2_9BACT|nr:flagellar biosynthetic protein FliR [Nannocystis poenicansa]WAS99548.1 flagellar biosynthetic protein FliR [Nannocystis poenicansa]